MNFKSNRDLLQNYIFLIGVTLLFINDQFLKFEFGNTFTGKLSDICGIIIFPFFLTFIFPKLKEYSVLLAGAIFTFWKSEYSQALIDFINKTTWLQASRVIDYTDLYVLILLPISFFIIKNRVLLSKFSFKIIPTPLLFFSTFFILLAESPPLGYYYTSTGTGNLRCYNCKFEIEMSRDTLLRRLEEQGIVFDSVGPIEIKGVVDSSSNVRAYYKKELTIDNKLLKNISLTMMPLGNTTTVFFTSADVTEDIEKRKIYRKLVKIHKKLIHSYLKEKLN